MHNRNLNPSNYCDREDLIESNRVSLDRLEGPTAFINIRTPEDRLREACLAAQKLLENGEASELTVALPADEVHEVMTQLTSVLGKS